MPSVHQGEGRRQDTTDADFVRGVTTDAGPVPADATAVILNVTVTNVTSPTDVRVYPSDAATLPGASNLNPRPAQPSPTSSPDPER